MRSVKPHQASAADLISSYLSIDRKSFAKLSAVATAPGSVILDPQLKYQSRLMNSYESFATSSAVATAPGSVILDPQLKYQSRLLNSYESFATSSAVATAP